MKKWFCLLAVIFIAQSNVFCQSVQVENVRFTLDNGIVYIYYDLLGDANAKYTINLTLSDDFGEHFRIYPLAVVGDIGKNVKSGKKRRIVWNYAEDFPSGLTGDGFMFAVDAQKQTMSKSWYYIGGSVLAAGIGYGVWSYFNTPEDPGDIEIIVPAIIEE